ncbi:MAG: hypothetical protein EOP83_28325 [Verrucomicrobiaceae bacterium]|nr:MAG: hypothetical protein EOP83_28325 [Verrucomicrobiaceae bacterium]
MRPAIFQEQRRPSRRWFFLKAHPPGPSPWEGPSAWPRNRGRARRLHPSERKPLATLPDEQRVCWVLREMNELSYPEIAYATHLPVSTVRGRIARARQNLMRGMDAWR